MSRTTYVSVSRIKSTGLRRAAIVAAFVPMAICNALLAICAAFIWMLEIQGGLIRSARDQWRTDNPTKDQHDPN